MKTPIADCEPGTVNHEPPASRGVIAFYGDRVLVIGRCGRWVISNATFCLFARTLPDFSAAKLAAWLWMLRGELTGLDYSKLHGVN